MCARHSWVPVSFMQHYQWMFYVLKYVLTVLIGMNIPCFPTLNMWQRVTEVFCSFFSDARTHLKTGCTAVLEIDPIHRIDIMRNYTAAFIVNSVLKDLFPVFYCKHGVINETSARLICRVLGKELNFVGKNQSSHCDTLFYGMPYGSNSPLPDVSSAT